jgi:branched-chain amino acid transport system ATP-binding protein
LYPAEEGFDMSLLQIEELGIHFGGLQALDSVNFHVEKGEILAIIGPNGSGKTTIFNCINRIYKPQRGSIVFKGKELLHMRASRIASLGIARTFQNVELFPFMTGLDNLLLARHCHLHTGILSAAFFLPWVRKEEIKAREKVEEIIEFLEIEPARRQLVANLPFGIQKLVEIGRALAIEPELVLLDEPAAGMNVEEREDLALYIREMHQLLGLTLVIIEHDLRLVMDISDRVIALNFGRKIAEGKPKEVQKDPEVLKAYIGEKRHAAGYSDAVPGTETDGGDR